MYSSDYRRKSENAMSEARIGRSADFTGLTRRDQADISNVRNNKLFADFIANIAKKNDPNPSTKSGNGLPWADDEWKVAFDKSCMNENAKVLPVDLYRIKM